MIGAIYDATIEPERWYDAIEAIRTRFDFEIAMLGILRPDATIVVQVSCNVPVEYQASLAQYAEDVPKAWGGFSAFVRLPLEEPLLNSDQPAFLELESNRFYHGWVKPQGLADQCMIVLANDGNISATLGLGIHQRRGPLSELQIDELRLLAPHLRRAAIISGILDRSAQAAGTFSAVLDTLPAGALLVGSDLEIVHANAVAEQMLRSGSPIRNVSGRLELVSELLRGGLAAAVASAANEAELGRRGIGIPALRPDGSAIAVHVMPLDRRSVRDRIAPRAVAAVFVSDSVSASAAPTDAAMLLYGLTPAEARVFELVVSGRSSTQMSAELGIRPSTVRTHLLRVFDKTGRHNRSDLVRLASEIKLPL